MNYNVFILNKDLVKLYELISQIPTMKNAIVKFIENYIYEKGINSISINVKTNFEIYIQTVYNIHQKYFKLLQPIISTDCALNTCFNRVSVFHKLLFTTYFQACRKFVNNNALTQTIGETVQIPERLARYCDVLLRKRKRFV
jgi:hypothetical protein